MFYVYKWYIIDTKEVIYIGKGTRNRYKNKKRNKLFNEMIKRFDCKSEIIKYFDNEKDAFQYEHELICEYKNKGECCCNLDNGGTGGVNFIWTPEMKHYYSVNNIMKSENQRKRMSENNPMKNKEIAKKVGEKHKKPFYINDVLFDSIKNAAKKYNVGETTISYWLKVGHNNHNDLVYYKDKEKPTIDFTINRHITNNQKVKYDDKIYTSIKELSKELNVKYTTLFSYCQRHKTYNNKYIEKI